MKEIPLTQGYVAIVNDEDYEACLRHKWFASRHGRDKKYVYAMTRIRPVPGGPQKTLFLHRFLMGVKPGQEVDHVSGDTLDDRRCNLRLVDRRGNQNNRIDHSRWGPGIDTYGGKNKPFRARIFIQGKLHQVGHFATPEEAAVARAHYLHAYQFSCALAGVE